MKRIINIEVAITGDNPIVKLPEMAVLRGKSISTIMAYNADQITTAPDGGVSVVSAADAKKSFLTIKKDNTEIFKTIPLVLLNPTLNQGINYDFEGQQFDISECSIICKGSVTTSTVLLYVEYFDR